MRLVLPSILTLAALGLGSALVLGLTPAGSAHHRDLQALAGGCVLLGACILAAATVLAGALARRP